MNVRRTLVKRYSRFLNQAVGWCLFLGALGIHFLVLVTESAFPVSGSPHRDGYPKTWSEFLVAVLLELPLDVLRWCGVSAVMTRLILTCGALACFGGVLAIVVWTRRMKKGVPPPVKLRKVVK